MPILLDSSRCSTSNLALGSICCPLSAPTHYFSSPLAQYQVNMLNTARRSFPGPSKSLVSAVSYAGRTSMSPQGLPHRKRNPPRPQAFHTTPRWSDFHFDTHHFVQRLEREGLNRAQAEGIMSAMAEVIDESIRNMTSNMVTKADQEKVHRTAIHTLRI